MERGRTLSRTQWAVSEVRGLLSRMAYRVVHRKHFYPPETMYPWECRRKRPHLTLFSTSFPHPARDASPTALTHSTKPAVETSSLLSQRCITFAIFAKLTSPPFPSSPSPRGGPRDPSGTQWLDDQFGYLGCFPMCDIR
jgi:hypothetical protein